MPTSLIVSLRYHEWPAKARGTMQLACREVHQNVDVVGSLLVEPSGWKSKGRPTGVSTLALQRARGALMIGHR